MALLAQHPHGQVPVNLSFLISTVGVMLPSGQMALQAAGVRSAHCKCSVGSQGPASGQGDDCVRQTTQAAPHCPELPGEDQRLNPALTINHNGSCWEAGWGKLKGASGLCLEEQEFWTGILLRKSPFSALSFRALSRRAKVVGASPHQGAHKNQPMSAWVGGATN